MPRDHDAPPMAPADALCRVLKVGDDAQRFYAAQALGRIGAVGTVPNLIAALHDDDPDVRSATAAALGELGDAQAVAPLLENLKDDPSGDVKLNAVIALGRLADIRSVPLLRQLVRDRGEDVVWDEEEFLAGGWDDWLDIQLKAIEALGQIGAPEAVPDIVAAISDADGQDLSEPGCMALARLGADGVDALAGYLDTAPRRLRRSAVRALAEAAGRRAQPHLQRALSDTTPDVRLIALQALLSMNDTDPMLLQCLHDPSATVRAAAVRGCGSVSSDVLNVLIDDPDDGVQAATVERLAQPGSPEVPGLEKRLRVKLRGPSERVAIAAADHLVQLAPDIALTDLTEQASDKACPTGLRCAALQALGTLSDRKAIEAVTHGLTDAEHRVRATATIVLGGLAATDESARDVLIAALNPASDDHVEKAEAAPVTDTEAASVADAEAPTGAPAWPTSTLAALQSSGAPESGEQAESVELTEEDLDYLELAGRQKSRKKHVPLEPDLAPDVDVRRMAARVLGDTPAPAAVQALHRCLHDTDDELRRSAAESLGRIALEDAAVVAPLTRELIAAASQEKDTQARCALLRTLGSQANRDVERLLIGLLANDNSFVRAAAVAALARMAPVGEEVEARLADVDPAVRLAAAKAIARDLTPDRTAKLIGFAFSSDGLLRQGIGSLLRDIAPDEAGNALSGVLLDDTRRRDWRIAIETLQETARPA